MNPITVVSGRMVPLPQADIDTDQIIPKQFLTRIERSGYGEYLFLDWGRDADGNPLPGFFTNDPTRQGAKILIAGDNFGCGSSREHAVWALQQWGFDAVVSTSFADIFKSNSHNSGLLPVQVTEEVLIALLELAQDPLAEISINLESRRVSADGIDAGFEIDPTARDRMLKGLDPIGVTLELDDDIAEYESRRFDWLPTTV